MIDFTKIGFENQARQRLRQIYAVLFFMNKGQAHNVALHSALSYFHQVKDVQTIRDKCARQFAGNIGTFAEWYRLGLMVSKIQEKLNLSEHDLYLFKELLKEDVVLSTEEESIIEKDGLFGSPEENKTIEEAAVKYAVEWFKSNGWYVESIESLKCGFDLLCTRDEEVLNVEVKGTSGSDIKFIMTKNEYNQTHTNSNFIVFVVTKAKTNFASHIIIKAEELLNNYSITPLEYIVQNRPLTTGST